MKLNLLKSPIFAVLVIVGLAAGTALVAGYVDKPNQAAENKCDGCPRLDTETCCKVTGVCADPQTCTGSCIEGTSEAKPAGCCPGMAQTGCAMTAGETQAACPMMAGQEVESPCGAGGCTQAE